MRKINTKIFIFFTLLVTTLFGSEVKIPHEKIVENPKKEVTIVESKKLKENAKLNISVNKKNIEEIVGYEVGDKLQFILPEEKTKIIKNEDIILVKSLAELPNTYQGNKKNKMISNKIIPILKDEKKGISVLEVDKSEVENNVYIAKIDKGTGVVNTVYKGVNNSSQVYGGTTIIRIDKKVLEYAVNYAPSYDWIDLKGRPGNTPTSSTSGYIYSDFINIENPIIFEPISWSPVMPQLTLSYQNTVYQVFKDSRNIELITLPINGITISVLYEYILINYKGMFGSNFDVPSFVFTSLKSTAKDGRIRDHRIEFILEDKYPNGVASIDLSTMELNKEYTFNSQANPGLVEAYEDSNISLTLHSGKLLQTSGYSGPNVVSNLLVKKDSITNQYSGKEYQNNDFKILLDGNGNFKVTKLKNQKIDVDLEITPRYSDLSMGTMQLKVINNPEIPIGDIELKIDSRLKNLMETRKMIWINGIGGISVDRYSWNSGLNNNDRFYSDLISKKGNIVFQSPIKEWIEVKDRTLLVKEWANRSIFSKKVGNSADGLVLGHHQHITDSTPISSEIEFLKVSAFNFENLTKGQSETDELIFKGQDDKLYKIGLKIEVDNNSEIVGVGNINLTDMEVNKEYTFATTSSSGIQQSLEDKNITLEIESGGLPNLRSYSNVNLMSAMNVTFNKGVTQRVAGKIYNNENYQISFDNVNGNLVVMKKKETVAYTDEIVIEPVYSPDNNKNSDLPLGKVTLKLDNKSKIFAINQRFNVDTRIQRKHSGGLFFANGLLKYIRSGSSFGPYPELLSLNTQITNGTENIGIAEAISVEGREIKVDTANGITRFEKIDGSDIAMILSTGNIGSYKTNSVIEMNTRKSDSLENKFSLRGTDGNIYNGIIYEEYTEKYFEGTATLDLTNFAIGTYGQWAPQVTGDSTSTSSSPYVLKMGNTKLLESRGFANSNIITKLVVKQNGVEKEVIGTIGNKIQVDFPENKIWFEGTGELCISKELGSLTSNTYEIIPYYEDLELGKVIITIQNDKPIPIGDIELKIDSRLRSKMNDRNKKWSTGFGGIEESKTSWNYAILNADRRYPELISKKGNIAFQSPIKQWIEVKDRKYLQIWGDRTIFSKKGNLNSDGIGLITTGIFQSSEINSEDSFLKESMFYFGDLTNGQSETDELIFKGKDDKFYKIGLKLEVDTNSFETGDASIELSNMEINKTYTFNKNSNLGIISPNEDTVKAYGILNSGKLPQTQGYLEANIVTQMKITLNNGTPQMINGKIYENDKYRISFDNPNGDLQIIKLKEDLTYTDEVIINYMTGNEAGGRLSLGEVKLELDNIGKIEIGTVTFELDTRFSRVPFYWISKNGDVRQSSGKAPIGNYSELIKVTGNYSNVNSAQINRTEIEGGQYSRRITTTSPDVVYEAFDVPPLLEGKAIPVEIPLNKLEENLMVAYSLTKNSAAKEEGRFILSGADRYKYLGNLKEVYNSTLKNGYDGKGKLNLTKMKRFKEYTFTKTKTGLISSFENPEIILNLENGKLLPQTQGYYNPNIITSIKVSKNGGTASDIQGMSYEDNNYDIKFNTKGELVVIKKSILDYSDTLNIECYYNDLMIGNVELKLENKPEVSIDGINEINFGAIVQGRKIAIDTKMIIKSTSKIVTVGIDNTLPKELIHNTTNEKLPYTAKIYNNTQGNEIPVWVGLELDPAPNQTLGDYTGELNIIVTIE